MADLTPDDVARIYKEKVRPHYFRRNPAPHKTLTMLGGQPGAGKSVVSTRLKEENRAAIYLSGDDLRQFIPDLKEMIGKDPIGTPARIKPVTSAWMRAILHDAQTRGDSLIIEGIFNDPAVPTRTINEYAAQGYEVDVVVLGVPRHASLHSALDRPIRERIATGGGRYTALDHHDAGYHGTREMVRQLPSIEAVGRVRIIDRNNTTWFDATRTDTERFDSAVDALDNSRQITNANGIVWLAELRHLTQEVISANLNTGEVRDYLAEMHHVALDEVIPALELPENSNTRQALAQRVTNDLNVVTRDASADPTSTGVTIQPAHDGPDITR